MTLLRPGLCPGLTPEAVALLREQGVHTVVDLASSDLEALAQRCSLSFKGLSSSRRLLLARFSSFPANGTDLFEELHKGGAILPTGTPSLDRLLDTGLYTGEITEFVGAPGSGKTQTCLEIAAHTALVLKQAVLYVDSSGGFSAARLLQILGRMTASQEEQTEALRRVHVMRVFEAYKMLDVLQDLRSSLAQQALSGGGGSAKVLVLDSAWALLSPVLGGRSPDGLALMSHLALEMKTLAKDFGVALVLTNAVTRDPSGGRPRAALGRSWASVPHTRVLLEKDGPGNGRRGRRASLVKSPRQVLDLPVMKAQGLRSNRNIVKIVLIICTHNKSENR
ncbi:DNA repair protein RAD51 homolog 4 isoform X4 [Anolis carolinensis]|uniref:DNA repair protein RAD51 homolog 4 isoform X4 n=1 Tax=Anolis carolinensis TaxID=28377 RepID=UPI002F2B42D1